ncbi:MAG: hypothetical protein KatS3mg131_1682 [Candidatus Tectimicrobiota bacterium]|nr:MAG: hypothetical protein KatS3mg131_1682 [Candidatus Tectomicrobia bacterium]
MCSECPSSSPSVPSEAASVPPVGTPNPQPAPSSVGHALYHCVHYSACLGVAAAHGWSGLSCKACTAYQPMPGEAIPYDACAQLLGAVLRTAQHDLEHCQDENFWEAAAFVFRQSDFPVLCGLLGIDPVAARKAQWDRLTPLQRQALLERWPDLRHQL